MLEPEVSFQVDGSFSPGPLAKFLDMPQSPLFTLNLNTPESWMVESVHTRYDLDNIYLEEVQQQFVCLELLGCSSFMRVSQSVSVVLLSFHKPELMLIMCAGFYS